MNRFGSLFKPLMWFMALLLSALLAGCGSGGGEGPDCGSVSVPIETGESGLRAQAQRLGSASGSVGIDGEAGTSVLSVGKRIMACLSGTNVRNAQFADPSLFTQVGGVHGTITNGPEAGGGSNPFYTGNWWQINWDSKPPNQNGIQGWSAEFAILLAPSAGDVPQPSLSSRYYTTDNLFFPANAPNSIGGSVGALGNCTWYAHGRLRELGYNSTQLNALHGNASDWAAEALAAGISVDNNPTVGSIAQVNSGSFSSLGHVAVVESVNTDGTITVTESSYSTDTTSVWNFLWRHRTVSPTWFSNFIHVSKAGFPTDKFREYGFPDPTTPETMNDTVRSGWNTLKPYAEKTAQATGVDVGILGMWPWYELGGDYINPYIDNCDDKESDPNTECPAWGNWQVGYGVRPGERIGNLKEAFDFMHPGESAQTVGQKVINESGSRSYKRIEFKQITNPATFPNVTLGQIVSGAEDGNPEMRHLAGLLMKDDGISIYLVAKAFQGSIGPNLANTMQGWGRSYDIQKIVNYIAGIYAAGASGTVH